MIVYKFIYTNVVFAKQWYTNRTTSVIWKDPLVHTPGLYLWLTEKNIMDEENKLDKVAVSFVSPLCSSWLYASVAWYKGLVTQRHETLAVKFVCRVQGHCTLDLARDYCKGKWEPFGSISAVLGCNACIPNGFV